MEISGSYTLYAPRERVWTCLLDPTVLKGAIPGCEQLVQTAEDQYRIRLTIAAAGVKGTYEGTLRLADRHELEHYRMALEGSGMRSALRGDGTVMLEARGPSTTVVTYQGEAHLSGAFAGIGGRVAGALARRLINRFFARIADVLAGEAPSQPTHLASDEEQTSVTAAPARAIQPTSGPEWAPGLPEARSLGAEPAEAVALPLTPMGPPESDITPVSRAVPPPTELVGMAMPAFLTDFVRRAGLSDGTRESEQRLAWGIAVAGGVAVTALAAALAILATRIRDR